MKSPTQNEWESLSLSKRPGRYTVEVLQNILELALDKLDNQPTGQAELIFELLGKDISQFWYMFRIFGIEIRLVGNKGYAGIRKVDLQKARIALAILRGEIFEVF